MSETRWRRCSACKQPIELGATYWTCNVSTCNRKRTGLVFCSVTCWDVHLPTANHREAWAEEKTAPTRVEAAPPPRAPRDATAKRRYVVPESAPRSAPAAPREVLIIGSRLKDYIRARSGFNTSEKALEPLSRIVREACDRAIEKAAADGRKTVLDRDFPGI